MMRLHAQQKHINICFASIIQNRIFLARKGPQYANLNRDTIKSILSEPDNFLAWKCDDLDLSKNNKYRSCSYDGGDLVPMGEHVTTKGNPTGIYYLHTTGIDGNYSCNDQDSCFA